MEVARTSQRPARSLPDVPVVILTTAARPAARATATRPCGPPDRRRCFDVVGLLSADDRDRLRRYATGMCADRPQPGFWTSADLDRLPLAP